MDASDVDYGSAKKQIVQHNNQYLGHFQVKSPRCRFSFIEIPPASSSHLSHLVMRAAVEQR